MEIVSLAAFCVTVPAGKFVVARGTSPESFQSKNCQTPQTDETSL